MSTHVFAIKICLERRYTSPLTSAHGQGPKQVPNNLFWCSYCPRKVFARPQTKSVNFKIVIFEQFLIKFDFWRALECLKPQKSASGDVFAFKNRLKHRMMLSFTSTCCHGLKQVCNNLFWCFWCIKKFFYGPTSIKRRCSKVLGSIKFCLSKAQILTKTQKIIEWWRFCN